MTDHPKPLIVDEAAEWLERGTDVCSALKEERIALVARLQAINEMLARIPGARTPEAGVPDESLSQIIRRVLNVNTEGLQTASLTARVQNIKATANPHSIHVTLQRMRKAGEIVVSGPRGRYVYTLAERK